nr:YfiR family protein [Pseudodesulfovibrio sp.]
MSRVQFFVITLLFWTVGLCPVSSFAGGKQLTATSEQLQALYVQRLVKYVKWPVGAGPKLGEPYVIAATDSKKLKPYFNDASLQFRLVQWPADGVHVLVINGAPKREAAAILKRTAEMPVLTIGQSPANLRQGVVINFRMVGGKLKLQVNPHAAGAAGLNISSRLLRIATIYRGESHEQ